MKFISLIATFVFTTFSLFAQTTPPTKDPRTLTFSLLGYGLISGTETGEVPMAVSPTGRGRLLEDIHLQRKTDSIPLKLKQQFGIFYVVKAKMTVDVKIEIEWIYPKKITNKEGKVFSSIRYTITKPTNNPLVSTYSIDEPFEMIKGKWVVNIYLVGKRMTSKSFTLY